MKVKERVEKMTEGGKIIVEIMKEIISHVEPGVTTLQLDRLSESLCSKYGVKPAFKGYEGFPNTLCVGPNDTVVHGIPDDIPLEEGDILSLDVGIVYKKVYLDMARTVGVGKVSKQAEKFMEVCELALKKACSVAVPGNRVGDISFEIQSYAESHGYSVVREMVGHSVGERLHEEPMIPGVGSPNTGELLYDGQTIAIEAIFNMGGPEISISRKDGWTSKTKDGSLSALFENTVVVAEEPKILTLL
ncbi:MAG: type I methionyl aminopeptidase [bacterium]